MRRRYDGAGSFVSISCGYGSDATREVRDLSRLVKEHVCKHQRKAGMRNVIWVEVLETKDRAGLPKPGCHVVACLPTVDSRDKLIDSFSKSTRFGGFQVPDDPGSGRRVQADPVTDWEKAKTYGLKEMSSQSAYRTGIRRIQGSHRLPGGGDRVRLSDDLQASLERSGRITPYTRTYAQRTNHERDAETIH